MKKAKGFVMVVGLLLICCICVNFIMFPEIYVTTARYHLGQKLSEKDELAMKYYIERYLNHGIILFPNLVITNANEEVENQNGVIEEQVVEQEETQIVEEQVSDVVEEPIIEEQQPTYRSLGTFRCSAYCNENYPHICNNGDASRTATGTTPTAGRTIAVDPRVIPLGSHVLIDGHEYIAEDTGGGIKGNRIDIVFNSHREALNFGIQYKEVFIIE